MKFERIQGEKSLHKLDSKLPMLYKWITKSFKEANDYINYQIEEGLYNETMMTLLLKGMNKENNYHYEIDVVIENNNPLEFLLYLHQNENRWKVYELDYSEINWLKVMQYINELERVGLTKVEETIIKQISFIID